MEYFKILNLQREPFSNSPEPDLFFQSDQHLACLQQVELAIRLRRGLSVVLGDVGLGKTTLCRQIIRNFSRSEVEGEQIETHLIMDPSFSSVQEFLATAALLLGLDASPDEQSEWQVKENIKKYLFKQGVEGGKIVVLIIDEGQKLPSFCVEILREFLNYETNEYKLLQIIIFAQREFEDLLRSHVNFADRVNHYIHILPLNLKNTRNMIMYRMAAAAVDPSAVPSFFTLPALLAIYWKTKGYPRRINALCHQTILAMIIQNRRRAGFFLVCACADRVKLAERIRWPRLSFGLSVGSFILLLLIVVFGWNALFGVSGKRTASKASAPVAGFSFPRLFAGKGATALHALVKRPSELGRLTMKNDERVLTILERIYGRDAAAQQIAFAEANPHIANPEMVKRGETVSLPVRTGIVQSLPPGKCWLQINSLKDIQEAYIFMSVPANGERFFLLPYWRPQEGLTFAILLKDGFGDESTAQSFKKALPSSYRRTASVVSGWQDALFL